LHDRWREAVYLHGYRFRPIGLLVTPRQSDGICGDRGELACAVSLRHKLGHVEG